MKALILAGGAGTRLRPITHTRAKQLVPVANTPILFYGIRAMVDAGIVDIGVIIGDTGPEVRDALGDGSAFGARITYLPQDAPLGLAHCVLIARQFLAADDFVMYLGDNLLEQDLGAFVDAFERARGGAEPPAAQILLKQVPDPHRFGIATLDAQGHVLHLVEKPDDPPSDLALVGVYLFDPTIHEAVAAIAPSARGELEITDAIQWLIDNGHRVRTELLSGWWIDTGKLTPLLEANRLLLDKLERRVAGTVDASSIVEGRVVVDEGAEIVNSTVRGPVAIGRGTRLVDSFIGPFSAIGNGCEIVNSEIEHSVVMDGSKVFDIPRLEDSLIGREAVINRTQSRPRALRLMIGDHCQIDIE
ncbi:MAG: glucose-1-phosphate thymidylyltransferase [Actinomycetota bacterium]|nr:glucose-1-phosphate thymidylyltransferase [Acidimicrobiia bacterium]MDQ3469829.1 glucose-1-phosphate thymidylyltransferase [Actinomycetota bacterium]